MRAHHAFISTLNDWIS